MADEIQYMDMQEFLDGGFLQEANRKFFHPLGLALSVVTDEDGKATGFGQVWDYRDDPEGIYFAEGTASPEKRDNVAAQQKDISRLRALGFIIQPIEGSDDDGSRA
jgi:hypothetical protein